MRGRDASMFHARKSPGAARCRASHEKPSRRRRGIARGGHAGRSDRRRVLRPRCSRSTRPPRTRAARAAPRRRAGGRHRRESTRSSPRRCARRGPDARRWPHAARREARRAPRRACNAHREVPRAARSGRNRDASRRRRRSRRRALHAPGSPATSRPTPGPRAGTRVPDDRGTRPESVPPRCAAHRR